MPRKGQAIAIDDDWRREVERRLVEKGWSRADLAREAKCGRNDISDLLNGKRNQSPIVRDIERVLGMKRRKRTKTELQLKIDEIVDELPESDRILILERALALRDSRRS